MTIEEIKTVSFIGAGTMGCFNGLVAAIAGYDVTLYDIDPHILKEAPRKQQEIAAFLVGLKYFPEEVIAPAIDRITLFSDLQDAIGNADLISESVFERLDVKRQVHQQLDRKCSPETILTTNSSAFVISDLDDIVARGDRFAALHSHLGAPLFDIVAGSRTSDDTIDILKRYVGSLGGVALVLKKEHPGYVFNAMIGPLLTVGISLVVDGLATMEDVDRAWMTSRNALMGPFGMMDLFGIDVVFDSWAGKDKTERPELREKIVPFLGIYREKGELGMKTGKGFYTYPDPLYADAAFLQATSDVSLPIFALTTVLLQNAVFLAQKEIADPHDIDRAWMAATTLDTGPFGILDQVGIDKFLDMLDMSSSISPPEIANPVKTYLQTKLGKKNQNDKESGGFYHYPDPRYRQTDFLRGS